MVSSSPGNSDRVSRKMLRSLPAAPARFALFLISIFAYTYVLHAESTAFLISQIDEKLRRAVSSAEKDNQSFPIMVGFNEIIRRYFPIGSNFDIEMRRSNFTEANFDKVEFTTKDNSQVIRYNISYVSDVEYRLVSYFEVGVSVDTVNGTIVDASGFATYRTLM